MIADPKTDILSKWQEAVPLRPQVETSDWAKDNVMLPGSGLSSRYQPEVTPWTRQVVDWIGDDHVSRVSFAKPVQTGGSVVGEIAACYFIATSSGGDIQWNWEDDEKAKARYKKRLEKVLKACGPVAARWPQDRTRDTAGLVLFPHLNLIVQGAFKSDNLDSDSIRVQINEELHNWKPGRLQKAYNRLTAFRDSFAINISNASFVDDQFHNDFKSGTCQEWEVPCPSCGKFFAPRMEVVKDQPGGLHYDLEGAIAEDGRLDVEKVKPTIFLECPHCEHKIRDDLKIRRKMSLAGKYSEPKNPAAPLWHRTATLEAVSVDYIPWINLVVEKNNAFMAMRLGDLEPWKRFNQERCSKFWSPENRPILERITTSGEYTKNREGLPNRILRACAIDRQQGSLKGGDFPHYWIVIRDFEIVVRDGFQRLDSLLVFEGRLDSDSELEAMVEDHAVKPHCTLIDSGDDTMHVYRMCLRNGWYAIKGTDAPEYKHRDGGRRMFTNTEDDDALLYHRLNGERTRWLDGTARTRDEEPRFVLYSKHGIRERYHWLKQSTDYRVPSDVSEDYQKHMNAEERREGRKGRTNQSVIEWVKVAKRNDLFVCECYCVLLADIAGLLTVNGSLELENSEN